MTLTEALMAFRLLSKYEARVYRQDGRDPMVRSVCQWAKDSPVQFATLQRIACPSFPGEQNMQAHAARILADGQWHAPEALAREIGCSSETISQVVARLRRTTRVQTSLRSDGAIRLEPNQAVTL